MGSTLRSTRQSTSASSGPTLAAASPRRVQVTSATLYQNAAPNRERQDPLLSRKGMVMRGRVATTALFQIVAESSASVPGQFLKELGYPQADGTPA